MHTKIGMLLMSIGTGHLFKENYFTLDTLQFQQC